MNHKSKQEIEQKLNECRIIDVHEELSDGTTPVWIRFENEDLYNEYYIKIDAQDFQKYIDLNDINYNEKAAYGYLTEVGAFELVRCVTNELLYSYYQYHKESKKHLGRMIIAVSELKGKNPYIHADSITEQLLKIYEETPRYNGKVSSFHDYKTKIEA